MALPVNGRYRFRIFLYSKQTENRPLTQRTKGPAFHDAERPGVGRSGTAFGPYVHRVIGLRFSIQEAPALHLLGISFRPV